MSGTSNSGFPEFTTAEQVDKKFLVGANKMWLVSNLITGWTAAPPKKNRTNKTIGIINKDHLQAEVVQLIQETSVHR